MFVCGGCCNATRSRRGHSSPTAMLFPRIALLIAFTAVHCVGWSLSAGDVHGGRGGGSTPTAPVEPRPFVPRPGVRSSILDLPFAEAWCTEQGLQPAHLQKVYGHLFTKGGAWEAEALAAIGLPRKVAQRMCDEFVVTTSKVVGAPVESEQGGSKFVVELTGGRRVETVLIRHDHKTSGNARHTVCVSSQEGCARACSFCATGTMGLLSQLTSAEILEQLWHARTLVAAQGGKKKAAPIRNVVFMGMGEPLDNLDALLESLRGISHQCLFNIGRKKVTISTVGGSAEGIRRLAEVVPLCRLALSLHSADQTLREELIPAAKKVPLPQLGEALDYHAQQAGCGAMLEYLLIQGKNDRMEDADRLAEFCLARQKATPKSQPAYVNLIPFNPTPAGTLRGYESPSEERVSAFHERLRVQHGINSLIRWSSAEGRDTAGACGQLMLTTQEPADPAVSAA